MYSGTVVIVSEPEVKRANRSGEEFVVARAAIRKRVYDRRFGAEVTETTYMGLTALRGLADQLFPLGVGTRVHVTGELQKETFQRRDGRGEGTDIKLLLSSIVVLPAEEEVPPPGDEDAPGGVDFLALPNGQRRVS